ncbi:hypothetical protein L3Q82_009465, partial [Scortum barcoo]
RERDEQDHLTVLRETQASDEKQLELRLEQHDRHLQIIMEDVRLAGHKEADLRRLCVQPAAFGQALSDYCVTSSNYNALNNRHYTFDDDVVLLASSSQDLQRVLERFAAECEAVGMRISTSKSEAMVLDRKRVACPLRVGGEVLPQVEEFKYLGVSCSRVRERWSVRLTQADWCSVRSYARSVYRTVVVKKELSRKAKLLDLSVNLRSHPHLWS